ncbi:TylF/MycF family methyltransferase [Rhodomicrobium sp. Az07]|uniref:TylF/MycF/NovP-related O-methyltransferase n=1 Tax=Rhodomicrobium sp. Az07 TaxID=2839034 RepID=UPI001BE589F6|nr:TylF/MycF/NovP-related O-methyltransferase [Rhodomicrobium sp. Az07]MBT3069471.1 TylF/MycF family methyltransferase [Rhodomicrobium sp. Az07]
MNRIQDLDRLPDRGNPTGEPTSLRKAYLDLICDSLVGRLNRDPAIQPHIGGYDDMHRLNGWDWPSGAPSMIGWRRMSHLRAECERVLTERVPGDFLEAGVWRGGAAMMMRAVLKAYNIGDRRVFAADTFAGLPDDTDASDSAAVLHGNPTFSVSLDEVKAAFRRYGLLDSQVVFLEGPFAKTLPSAPVASLALLRLDGDTFASARDTLAALYEKLSPGGSLILDDYFLFEDNRSAVEAFRSEREIATPIVRIDDYGGYWIKDRRRG